jgi:hypothetical protein
MMNIINDSNEMRVAWINEGITEKEAPEVPLPPTPLLPVEGFPAVLQEIVNTCAETYCTPRDYWAGAVLIASALGIGNKLELITNYRNVPVFWLVLLGDVSSGKSNPIDFCLDYFKQLDSLSIRKYEEDLAEFNHLSAMPAKDRLLEGKSGKPVKPQCFQYILNDFTPEAMVEAHKTNNRGLLIERDELKGWIDDFNRYNKSGEQSNMISSWSGFGITYNRKTAGIMNIEHPCIMVCGGMQPDLLPTLAADNRLENGFLSRLCSVYPDNVKKADYNSNNLPDHIRTDWERYLSALVNMTKLELRLSADAQEKYSEWYNMNAQKSNDEPSGYLKGVYGKLDIISLRLSVVIRGMKMVCDGEYSEEITGEDMEAALAITEYFRATALKVYRRLFGSDNSVNLDKRDVAAYLYRNTDMNKAGISRLLRTSRSQVDRAVGVN